MKNWIKAVAVVFIGIVLVILAGVGLFSNPLVFMISLAALFAIHILVVLTIEAKHLFDDQDNH